MRFRIVFGVFLILAAVATLLVLVVLPVLPGANENPDVLNFMANILCEPGERAEVEVVVTHDSDGTGYTPYTTCIGREGERTDASGKHLMIAIIAFLVPFLIGLFMLIFNAGRSRREVTSAWDSGGQVIQAGRSRNIHVNRASASDLNAGFFAPPQVELKDGVLKVDGVEIRMDGINPDQVKILQGMSPIMMNTGTVDSGNFVAKLKEIQEALDAGLITQAEYDRLRQEIMDKLA